MPSWKKVVLHGSSGSLAHLTLENLTSQSVLATDASGNVIAGSISGYTLPTASTSTLGGIKVGNTLNISSGVLDAKTYQGAVATVLGEVPGSAGTAGIVPAASPAQASYFLKGDGTWAAPTNTVTRLRADNASSLLAGDFTITGSGATTVGYNNGVFTISSTDHDTTYSLFSGASASVNGAAGLVPGPRTGDQIKFLKGDGTWAVTPDTTYSTATSAALGLVKIGFTESGKDYPIELNASGQMFVNVPWSDTNTDTNTTYSIEGNQGDAGTTIVLTGSDNSKSSLIVAGSGATNVSYDTLLNTLTISSTDTNTDTTYSTATSTTLGLVKIGYTENGKNYPVELSSGQMFVNVPWTDTDTNTNTTYDLSAASITNGAAINLAGSDSTTDAVNIKGSGATTVSYDSTNRVLVISSTDTNTDTDTTYTAGTGLTLSGTTFSVTANTYAPASHTHSYLPLAGGTLTGALNINNSTQGSDAFYVDGVNGRLFTITDDLSDSLFSVNTIAGLPVIEAFADNTVKIGPFTSPVTIDTSGLLYVEGNQVATQTYVNTAISNLIDGAPAALDTLNELAAAINDNDSYASTITTALADKAPLASPALTGTPTAPTADTATNTTQIATTAFVKAQGYLKSYTDTVTRLGTGTGDLRSGDILLKGGGATSIAFASGTFTISSTDTNTWRPLGTGATDAAAGNHTHDDRYYTETEVDTLLAGKLGSTAKAADSNLLDGLDLHTGRNNEANKVVRTDDSGYIQAGWINTTSGGRSPATRIDRVYASDDSYLRYYSLEDFKVAIGLPKNSFNRQADYSATAGYHTGIMGYSNTYDVFNGLPHLGSGFIEFWNSPANAPDDSHWVGLQSFHAVNWGGVAGRNYGWQMVHRGGTTGDIRFNAQWGDSDYGWITIWNSANLTAVSQLTNDSGYITSYTDTNTVTSVGISGDLSTGNITLAGSGATSITKSGGTITITSTDTDTTYSNATTERAGLMSTTDKTKLDGIAASANNYSLPAASATVLGGIKIGTNLSIDTNGVVSSTDTNTWRPLGTGATDAAAGNHTHDDRYYTETESDGRYILNDFALITGATSEDVKSGTWSEVANNSSWGSYKPGNDSAAGYAYNDAPGYMEYNIPSGYSTAYIGQLRWDTGGYFDVHAVRSDGALVLRGRYLSKGAIENSSHSGDHDNQQIIKISGLDGMRSIRITNVTGRLHFQGIGWSKEADTDGTQVSETHWDLIYNKPSTFTPSSHTHDDRYYTESEVDTLLADKQASGTYLTALPAHTHTLSELSDRPGWFSPDTNMTANLANFNNSVPSGFYQYSNATNAPGSGWYNLINVRHSNRANDHGFQIAASYYDENIWTRTYQNGTGNNDGTFTTWRSLVHSGNIGSQSVNYAASAGSATTAGTVTGKSSIGKTAHTAGADDYHLELYSSDTGDSSKEVSIRFHQGSRYYAQLRYRSGGFRFTGGADDNLTPVYASTFYGDLSGNATTATTAGTANAVSWTNVSDKPTIPTNNNQLTNGAGYITSYVDTVTRVGITDDVSSGDIVIRGAGATTVSKSGGTITITSTDTDTNTWRPLGTGATDAAAGNHLHDDRYYTESEVDTLLGTKAASSHTHNIILTQGNYVWDASTRAGDYTTGIQTSFVNSATGWPDYGAVLHVGARGGGDAGGDFQLYMGHGSNYGGTSLRVRSADNDAEVSDSWTEWKTILDSSNVGNYALTALPSHTHDDRYYTESEVDTLLAGKAASSHTHDDRYYTETEVDTLLGGKLGSTAKAADSELIDGIDSTAIIYGGAGRASSRVSSMNDTNQKSGFYYEYSPTGNPFGEWWNWMTVAGNSWQSSNNYSFQLAHNFHGDDFYVRRMTNGTAYDWRKILDSSNIGSYAAAVSHTHDDRYYTESEVDTLLGTKAASSHTHGIGSITDASRWWNNFGDNHSTRTSFDAAGGTLSTGFGWRFVQGSGNSPGWGSVGNGQYYALTVGLGNDYDSNLYGMQLAIPRNSTNPYLSVRFEENRVLGAWQKISAAYADSAGSVAWSNVSGKPSTFDPSAHTHDDRYYTESEVDSLLNAKGAAIPVDQGGEALGNLASIEIVQEEQRVEFTTTSGNKFSVMLVA